MAASTIALGPVSAVVVFSDTPAELAGWYEDLFAARRVVDTPHFIGLATAGPTIFVQQTGEGHRPGAGGIRPHFRVDDCAVCVKRVIAAGGKVLLPPTDTGAELVAAVTDRDGNPLGFLESKI